MEKLVAVALKLADDMITIQTGKGRHCNVLHFLAKSGCFEALDAEQGFLTSEGRFVDRLEAIEIAKKSGQCQTPEHPVLYSEDLW